MSHSNARLTPVTRAKLVAQVLPGWPPAEVAPPVPRLPGDRRQVGAQVPRRRAGCVPRPLQPSPAQPPLDLVRQILAVELVHALDYRLHQLAHWSVVGVLGNGDHADAFSP